MSQPTLYINAVSCKAGGGVNDLMHTLPLLDNRLRKRGWNTHTWVVPTGRDALRSIDYPADRYSCVRTSSPGRRAYWEFCKFPAIVKQDKPSVVFQFSNFIFRTLPAPQLTVLRSPTFFSQQYANRKRFSFYQTVRYGLGQTFSRKTIDKARELFCISHAHQEDILQMLGPRASKVAVSYLGFHVPQEALSLVGQSRSRVLAQLPEQTAKQLAPLKETDTEIIVNIAHYYEHKNLGSLLAAADRLARKRPRVKLVLTAGLTQYSGPLSQQTRHDVQLAQELSRRGILLDVGPVPRDSVWKLLALADVFSFPSSLESFGHPLLESMSMQVPVLAADTRIHREICSGAARFHPVNDAEEIATQLDQILAHEAIREPLVGKGLRRVQDFSWQTHATELAAAIERIASAGFPRHISPLPAVEHDPATANSTAKAA